MKENNPTLFCAFEVHAPWPESLPKGYILNESMRHLTISYLGSVNNPSNLINVLNKFSGVPFKVGRVGQFDKCLFLPFSDPHVVAWQTKWLETHNPIDSFHHNFTQWLQVQGFVPHLHDNFLPHVTICRMPFDIQEWQQAFIPIPMFIKSLHLYESRGDLRYEPLWTYPLLAPFEEFEHTADVAFRIYGENMDQLQMHAFTALAFKCPNLLEFLSLLKPPHHIDDIIFNLNQVIAHADQKRGCSFKAVSYHGDIIHTGEILTWEMIVDV